MRLLYLKICILFAFFLSFFNVVTAQDSAISPVRIAVLAPLYLDSAFKGNDYNLTTAKISQYFLSGLEFYNGVMLAIDSLQKENLNIEVWVYDTHKQGQSIQQLTDQMQSMNFSLVIASISSTTEQKTLSDFSARNSIPVISETYPTDAYLNSNPFFIMVNPTWKTHIEAIYNFLNNSYKRQKIIYFTKRGFLEDKISETLRTLNASHTINFSNVLLSDNFLQADILSHLDSTKQNIVLCGSLNETFGKSLIQILNNNGDSYSTIAVGMPTWSGMTETLGENSDKLQIVLSTSYDYSVTNVVLDSLNEEYKRNYFAKPGDMVYKGFESMYHFTKLLLKYPDDFINNISDTSDKIFNNFDFEPIRISKTSFVPDYLENKKIYFVKISDGKIESVQ